MGLFEPLHAVTNTLELLKPPEYFKTELRGVIFSSDTGVKVWGGGCMRVWEETPNRLSDDKSTAVNAHVQCMLRLCAVRMLNAIQWNPLSPIPISIPDMRCVTNENKSRTIEAEKLVW